MSETNKNSEIEKIELPEKICQKSCRICSSSYLEEIHSLRKSGLEFNAIIEHLQKTHAFKIAPSSLSTHFRNYREIKAKVSAQIIKDDLLEEASEMARHTKAIVSLIDAHLKQLKTQSENGFFTTDISDLEKLMNIRHKILKGDGSAENDLVAIFQRAQTEYGVDVNQGILFKPKG